MVGREGWPNPWRGLPGASGPSKCEGTIEDHRNSALDVRELIRKQVFEQPVGTVFRPNFAFPWLRVMRLNSTALDLELVSGRVVVVPLAWANCGIMSADAARVPALWSPRLRALLP